MSSIHQVEPIQSLQHMNLQYFFKVDEKSLGCAILMELLLEISINQELFGYSRQFLKTK
jgi:hypothetical protein